MTPTIHFVSGIPRSGSTLLLNLLGQNPQFHVTPTSGLISFVTGVRDSWLRNDAFQAQGYESVEHRIGGTIRGMLYGFYEAELGTKKVVFDKNRNWLSQIEVLEASLRRPVKIVCTVRDVRAVVASFEKLYRSSPLTRRNYLGPSYVKAQTVSGRAQVLLGEAGIIGSSVAQLRDAFTRGMADRLIIVPYDRLTADPIQTLEQIYRRLNVSFVSGLHDPNNVRQITQEDDVVYGWGPNLHSIRPKITPSEEEPWRPVLPAALCRWIAEEFADINQLATPKGRHD